MFAITDPRLTGPHRNAELFDLATALFPVWQNNTPAMQTGAATRPPWPS